MDRQTHTQDSCFISIDVRNQSLKNTFSQNMLSTVIYISVSRKDCYMMCAGDLQQRYSDSGQDMSSKRASPGLVIGCNIDTSTGMVSFYVNGKEVANKFQVRFRNIPTCKTGIFACTIFTSFALNVSLLKVMRQLYFLSIVMQKRTHGTIWYDCYYHYYVR